MTKLFLRSQDYQKDILLKWTVEIDKTYHSEIHSDVVTKKNAKLPRRLSKNKYCISIGCDDNQLYVQVEGKSKISDKTT